MLDWFLNMKNCLKKFEHFNFNLQFVVYINIKIDFLAFQNLTCFIIIWLFGM